MALGDGTAWDETNPTNSTQAVTIDDHILDLRKGLRLRMANEHVWPTTGATASFGHHTFITLQPQGAAPTLATSRVASIFVDTDDVTRIETALKSSMPVPAIVQMVSTTLVIGVTATSAFSVTDDVPQQTDGTAGTEIGSISITPISSTNNLKVEAVLQSFLEGSNKSSSVALFQDATASAAWAVTLYETGPNQHLTHAFLHVMTAGTTGATTLKFFAGMHATSGGAYHSGAFGTKGGSVIIVTEYAV
ncbi:hypothetical protein LCGC14_1185060 [marine sediment metagenome]|uniref:Uncharacterized protein n=1 Tax=marine sediment metagenome TaxID=412755 RepID=A0A0F9LKZ1_9ZZZZ